MRSGLEAKSKSSFSRSIILLIPGKDAQVGLATSHQLLVRALIHQFAAAQDEDAELKARFAPVAKTLAENEDKITKELLAAQGEAVDIGGYYRPDATKCAAAMRPSAAFFASAEAAASTVDASRASRPI